MRRRLFLLALWLGGTVAATSVVFVAVAQLSSDLASVGAKNDVPPGGGSPTSTTTSTTSTRPLLVTLPTATAAGATTTTVAPTTTAAAPTAEPPATEEPTVPEPRTGPTGGRTSPTASPRTSVAGPDPTTSPATAAPTAPTTQPPPVTTPAPTAPATTAPASCLADVARVGRAGKIFFLACADGMRLSSVTVASTQWSYSVVATGPPTVTVTFTSGATTLACTITGNDEGKSLQGGCT